MKRSSARKRNERQGLLVEATAIEMAEQACLADSDFRKRKEEKKLNSEEMDLIRSLSKNSPSQSGSFTRTAQMAGNLRLLTMHVKNIVVGLDDLNLQKI